MEEGVHFKKHRGRRVEEEHGTSVAVCVRGDCRVAVAGVEIKAGKESSSKMRRGISSKEGDAQLKKEVASAMTMHRRNYRPLSSMMSSHLPTPFDFLFIVGG